jgi:hypothetical protein
MRNIGAVVAIGVGVLLGGGCTQTGLTKPLRSATEQLLISQAADEALAKADLSMLHGKKVFVDKTYFDGYDKDYVIGAVRDLVSRAGGLLMAKLEESEIVLEPRSGALSIDASSSVLGIPSSATPVPFAGAVQLPELALYKSEKEYSIAKIALLAYERESKKHVFSSGPLVGRANIKYFKFLGYIGYTKTTLPEKRSKKDSEKQLKKAEKELEKQQAQPAPAAH